MLMKHVTAWKICASLAIFAFALAMTAPVAAQTPDQAGLESAGAPGDIDEPTQSRTMTREIENFQGEELVGGEQADAYEDWGEKEGEAIGEQMDSTETYGPAGKEGDAALPGETYDQEGYYDTEYDAGIDSEEFEVVEPLGEEESGQEP